MQYLIVIMPKDEPMFVGKHKMRVLDNKSFDAKQAAAAYLRPFVATPAPFAMDILNGAGEIVIDSVTYITFILSAGESHE